MGIIYRTVESTVEIETSVYVCDGPRCEAEAPDPAAMGLTLPSLWLGVVGSVRRADVMASVERHGLEPDLMFCSLACLRDWATRTIADEVEWRVSDPND